MSNAVTTQQAGALRPANQFDLSPQTFDQALTFSNYLADSDLVPKDFKGKPGNCLIAMQWGSELGLKPLQSLQNLAVINGHPALWGDAVIALVVASPVCTVAEAADILKVHSATVEKLIASGELPAGRVGQKYIIKTADVTRYADQVIIKQTADHSPKGVGQSRSTQVCVSHEDAMALVSSDFHDLGV